MTKYRVVQCSTYGWKIRKRVLVFFWKDTGESYSTWVRASKRIVELKVAK